MQRSCVIEVCTWVQLPRLYNVYKEQGIIENFEQLLDNIFHPLFEVTRDPNSHPQLHLFLKNVSSALMMLQCLCFCPALAPCDDCFLSARLQILHGSITKSGLHHLRQACLSLEKSPYAC